MRHTRSLCFDSLEERKLLSRATSGPHARPAVTATSLVLTGTLRVQNKAAKTSMDPQGDVMTSTPVAGQLGTLGQVPRYLERNFRSVRRLPRPRYPATSYVPGILHVAFSEQKTDSVAHLAGGATETVPLAARVWWHRRLRPKQGEWHDRADQQLARTAVVTMTLTTQGV